MAAACSLARSIAKPLNEALSLVRTCADRLGLTCDWTPADEKRVHGITVDEWSLLEEPVLLSKTLRERSAPALAYALASNAYLLRDVEPTELHNRFTEIHGIFGWGVPALDAPGMAKALTLDYSRQKVLQRIRTEHASIPRMLITAMQLDLGLDTLAEHIAALGVFGVVGPEDSDVFLGLCWHEILKASKGPDGA